MSRNHILDFSKSESHLSVSHDRLSVRTGDNTQTVAPIRDVAVVIVSHPRVTYSQAVLSRLMDQGGAFVCCGQNYLPNGMMLPLAGNGTQTERFAAQSTAGSPLRKRLWQEIVRSKIQSQAAALEHVLGNDAGLRQLRTKVKSGDPANVEAQAARRYWSRLFQSQDFRRDVDADDENSFLNYGYAVLRSVVGRAICGAGLHPTIGLHHHNRYNAFCLADDLMEPMRPLVDIAVVNILKQWSETELGPTIKRSLVDSITRKYLIGNERRSLFDFSANLCSSLAEIFLSGRGKLDLPTFVIPEGPS